jgi:hypothetical protein
LPCLHYKEGSERATTTGRSSSKGLPPSQHPQKEKEKKREKIRRERNKVCKKRREMVTVGEGDVGDIRALFSCLATARLEGSSPFSIIDLSSNVTDSTDSLHHTCQA